MSLRNI